MLDQQACVVSKLPESEREREIVAHFEKISSGSILLTWQCKFNSREGSCAMGLELEENGRAAVAMAMGARQQRP